MTCADIRSALLRAAIAMLPVCGVLLLADARAAQVTVGWDYAAAGAAGFVLNCGESSGSYTSRLDVGSNTSFAIAGLTDGTTYYCVVAAYDAAKVEGSRSSELSIRVPYSKPVVSFTGSPTSSTAPASVAFTNSTKGQVTSWVWNFGDGTTGSNQNPTHVYGEPGSYTVTLTATGLGGTASVSGIVIQVNAATTGSTPSQSKPPSGSTGGSASSSGSTSSGFTSGGSTSTPSGSPPSASKPLPGPIGSTPVPVPVPVPPRGGTTSAGSTSGNTTPPLSPRPTPQPGATGSIVPATRHGPVAAYGFDEGSGHAIADASGHGNVGVMTNGTWAAGRFGRALNFAGNGWVTVNDSASLELSAGMTLEAWVNPSAEMMDWTDVIMKQRSWSADVKQGVSYYLTAASEGGLPVGGVTVRSERMVRGKSKVPAGRWSHLATTYDGSYQRLYVNGVLIASRTQAGKIATGSGPLRIGGDSLWGEYFHGLIDEVRVYNRALTIDEIRSDMNQPVTRAAH